MMNAGVGAVDFTPTPGVLLQGHGPVHSTRVLAPLEARAIVFSRDQERAAVITIDAIGLEAASVDRIRRGIRERCGIEADHILVAASHTHCGSPLLNLFDMPADPSSVTAVERAAVDCAARAAERMEPVRLALGCGSACFNINRRPLPGRQNMDPNPQQVVDRRVRVMRVDRVDGTPMAVLFHFSCHPTTLGGDMGLISPDYPGLARAQVESLFSCRALFMPGCFGNIRPFIDDHGQFKSADEQGLRDVAAQLSRAVCRAVEPLRTRRYHTLSAAVAPLRLNYGPIVSEAEFHRCCAHHPARRLAWTQARQRQASGELAAGEDSQVQAMRIGPLILTGLPGEVVQEIGMEVERRLWESRDASDIWACGYCNDMLGYLVTESQKREGGHEAISYFDFGRPAPFQDEQTQLVNAAIMANAAMP